MQCNFFGGGVSMPFSPKGGINAVFKAKAAHIMINFDGIYAI